MTDNPTRPWADADRETVAQAIDRAREERHGPHLAADAVLDALAAAGRPADPQETERLRGELQQTAHDRDVWQAEAAEVAGKRDDLAAERDELRARVAELEQQVGLMRTTDAAYWHAQKVLDVALGPNEDDGTGEGLAQEVQLVVQQRDEARARVAELEQALGDWRYNLAQRAFTAPDADLNTVLTSLDARITDLRDGALSWRDRAKRGDGHVATRVVTPADFPAPAPAAGGDQLGRWELPAEPGPEVTQVWDRAGRPWARRQDGWWDRQVGLPVTLPWCDLLGWAPLSAASPEPACGNCKGDGRDGPPETADPTGRIAPDIQREVDQMRPTSLGQRVALENTLQERRNRRTPPETAGGGQA